MTHPGSRRPMCQMIASLLRLRRIPTIARILIAIVLGILVGETLGPAAAPLSILGIKILDVIKGLAGPLLFFAVLDAFIHTEIRGKDAARMIGIAALNAGIAITIGLTLSNTFQPGKSFHRESFATSTVSGAEYQKLTKEIRPDQAIDFTKELLGYLPTSLVRPFVDNAIISIVILAVISGTALRVVKQAMIAEDDQSYRCLESVTRVLYRSLEVALGWVVALVPIAVFGVVAKAVGQYGYQSFAGLIPYVEIGVLGLLIQVLIVYQSWLLLATNMRLKQFWSGGKDAFATAMGTGSSLASLPVTLRCLDRMGVSTKSARLAACVGTNLNNDGILLYEAMAVLFVAQAIGVELTLAQQATAGIACIFAGIGISGVPDAGLISLLLVLKTVKLPEEAVNQVVPFLLAVDWMLGRCRSTTNVTSDMLVAILLDAGDKRIIQEEGQKSDPSGI